MTTSAGAVTMSPSATSRVRRPTLDVMATGNRIACHRSRSRLHAFFDGSLPLASVRRRVYKRGIPVEFRRNDVTSDTKGCARLGGGAAGGGDGRPRARTGL